MMSGSKWCVGSITDEAKILDSSFGLVVTTQRIVMTISKHVGLN
jgi:hypothetical protein